MKNLILIVAITIASATIPVIAEETQPPEFKKLSQNESTTKERKLTEEQKRYLDIVKSPGYAKGVLDDLHETNTNSASEKTNPSQVLEEAPIQVASFWRKENTNDLHNPWEGKTPEIPDDAPEVAKYLETFGVIIDKYNEEKFADALLFLDSQWETAKGNFKKKPHPYEKLPLLFSYERESKESSLELRSILHIYQDISPSPQRLLPATVNVNCITFRDGALIAAMSENPAISEEYMCILRRLKNGFQFCSFVPDYYKGEGTPWITWNKEWKITGCVTKKLFKNDFDFSDASRILLKEPNIP